MLSFESSSYILNTSPFFCIDDLQKLFQLGYLTFKENGYTLLIHKIKTESPRIVATCIVTKKMLSVLKVYLYDIRKKIKKNIDYSIAKIYCKEVIRKL